MKTKGTQFETPTFEGDPRTIPPEFGSRPIPEGMVRFNHYTRDVANLPTIMNEGLLQRHAQASYDRGGTEAPITFATAGAPSDDFRRSHNFVEGWADPTRGRQLDAGENYLDRDPIEWAQKVEGNRGTITMRGDIPASQIIGAHQPWHENFRYIQGEKSRQAKPGEDKFATGSMASQVARGEYDYLEKDPMHAATYGPAVKATKVTNAATVMLGGKL